jgi:hypothetical protein
MTVRQLIEFLGTVPQDMEIVTTRYSDCIEFDRTDISIINGVPRNGREYVMVVEKRHEPTLSAADRANMRRYLYFTGN